MSSVKDGVSKHVMFCTLVYTLELMEGNRRDLIQTDKHSGDINQSRQRDAKWTNTKGYHYLKTWTDTWHIRAEREIQTEIVHGTSRWMEQYTNRCTHKEGISVNGRTLRDTHVWHI